MTTRPSDRCFAARSALLVCARPRARAAIVGTFALFAVACGGPERPAQAPSSAHDDAGTAALPAMPSGPWVLPPREPAPAPPKAPGPIALDALREVLKVKGVAAAPARCAAFAGRKAQAGVDGPWTKALAETDVDRRDAMLAAYEASAPAADRGLVRAVRADLAPVECADALTDPWLFASKEAPSGAIGHALVGLSLAAKLSRTAHGPPQMPAASAAKEKVKEFIQGPLQKWTLEQAKAIEALSLAGRDLVGYGRGVAAVEAGTADLRLVDEIRSSPTPKEWDAVLRQVYEVALDEALEPRKARGRDAALVGLADLASAGASRDGRVLRARGLLSKLYGGRRIDALDALLLPGEAEDRGGPSSLWRAIGADGSAAAAESPSARALFERGRLYWHRHSIVEAAYAANDSKDPADRLVLALSLALAKGPGSAAAMMRAPSPSALELVHTDALDALAAEGGPLAGLAAYDAAHLRALSPPDGADAAPYLRDVAERFRAAARLLGGEQAHRRRAEERAAELEAAAGAISG